MSTASFIVVVEKATGVRNAGGMTATSDPYAKISTPTAPAVLNERTEVVQNNLNPVWDCCMLVALPASVPAMLKLEVFDSNTGTLVNGKDVLLGNASFDLATCTSNPNGWTTITQVLGGDAKAKGSVTLQVRPYKDFSVRVIEGVKLRNADGFFGVSDPFVRLTGLVGASMRWAATKTMRDTLSPTWNESFAIDLSAKMPMGGKLAPFMLEVWDEDDKNQNSPKCDRLGSAQVPWLTLWQDVTANGEAPKEQALYLKGSGAKKGSTVVCSFSLGTSAESLGDAGRALLASAIGGGGMGGGGAAAAEEAEEEHPPLQIPHDSCKAILSKTMGFKIADCTDHIADHFTMGLAWDVTNGQNIDLDASCLMLDASLSVVDTISFKQLKSKDGSMVHHGDEREGDEEGDDESISFDLELVNPQATYLCFCINSFSGQKLNDVKDAKCRLYDNTTSHELASFDITSDKRLDCTALLMCILYRASAEGSGSQDWYMHAVGEPAEGRTVKDNVDEFQHFLDENPLVALQASRATVVKTIKIQVPESAADGGTIAFATPAGGQQEVKLPPGAKAGDMIEVPLVDIYTA